LQSRVHLSTRGAAILLLAVVAGASARAIAAEPLDQLFGLRLGVPLAEQLVACPQGGRHPERPCAEKPVESRDGLFWSGIRLPSSVFAEAGLVSVRGIRVVGGRVVEIELEGMAADLGRLGRSVRQRKGAPHESETIERASRVGGLSRSRTLVWRDATYTIFFDEQSQSGQPRLRAFVNAWAARASGR
jgi:hypothetical protein